MLARFAAFFREFSGPKALGNPTRFIHKEVSNVQVVGQKRAYFLAVRKPEIGEKFLKLTERSGGKHTYVSINLSDLGVFVNSIEAASQGNKINRLILNNETFDVAKVDSLDGYNYSIRILKKKEGRKSNVLFIDELQLNRVIRVMKDVMNKHSENSE